MKIKSNLKSIISIIYTFILCFSYINLDSYAEPSDNFSTSSVAVQSETKPSNSSTPSSKQHMSSKPSPSSSIPPKAETTKPSNKNVQSSSIPSTVKTPAPSSSQNSQSTPSAAKRVDVNTSSSKKESEKKATTKSEVSNDESSTATETESSSAPADLPTVDDEEIAFPEVVAASSMQETKKNNSWAGIIAWICILAGIAIVIFVIINGRKSGEVPVQIASSNKPKTKKKKRLLPSEYYRDKF